MIYLHDFGDAANFVVRGGVVDDVVDGGGVADGGALAVAGLPEEAVAQEVHRGGLGVGEGELRQRGADSSPRGGLGHLGAELGQGAALDVPRDGAAGDALVAVLPVAAVEL